MENRADLIAPIPIRGPHRGRWQDELLMEIAVDVLRTGDFMLRQDGWQPENVDRMLGHYKDWLTGLIGDAIELARDVWLATAVEID